MSLPIDFLKIKKINSRGGKWVEAEEGIMGINGNKNTIKINY